MTIERWTRQRKAGLSTAAGGDSRPTSADVYIQKRGEKETNDEKEESRRGYRTIDVGRGKDKRETRERK